MIAWPTSLLPIASLEPFEGSLQGSIDRSEGQGFVDQRKVYNLNNELMILQFRFTHVQYAIFLSFLHWKLARGAAEFLLEVPDDDGELTEQVVRIVEGMFQAEFREELWTVTCNIELMKEALADA